MTKRTGITLTIAAILLVVSIFIPNLVTREVVDAQESTVTSTTATQPVTVYIIGIYDGKIAVFEEDGGNPIKIYDTYASTLPEFDRQSLDLGITVYGEEELARRIEDFTS